MSGMVDRRQLSRFVSRHSICHDGVIKWKHFPRYRPFVRGIHLSPVNSPHKGQWRGALMFSLICAWINAWVNNREAGHLRRHRAHYDVIVMCEEWVPETAGFESWSRQRKKSCLQQICLFCSKNTCRAIVSPEKHSFQVNLDISRSHWLSMGVSERYGGIELDSFRFEISSLCQWTISIKQ